MYRCLLVALAAQLALFAHPEVYASAMQRTRDVVVTITYGVEVPVEACTILYAGDDTDLTHPIDTHCWTPTNPVGDFDTWPGARLDTMGIIACAVRLRDGTRTFMVLNYLNT